MKEWDPEAVLAAVDLEIMTSAGPDGFTPSSSPEDMAMRIFKNALPAAAHSLCHMAVHEQNASVRLRAATYVVDRNLGRVSDASALLAGSDLPEWEKMIKNSVSPYVPDDTSTH
jgi:hypothetical protein